MDGYDWGSELIIVFILSSLLKIVVRSCHFLLNFLKGLEVSRKHNINAWIINSILDFLITF